MRYTLCSTTWEKEQFPPEFQFFQGIMPYHLAEIWDNYISPRSDPKFVEPLFKIVENKVPNAWAYDFYKGKIVRKENLDSRHIFRTSKEIELHFSRKQEPKKADLPAVPVPIPRSSLSRPWWQRIFKKKG